MKNNNLIQILDHNNIKENEKAKRESKMSIELQSLLKKNQNQINTW